MGPAVATLADSSPFYTLSKNSFEALLLKLILLDKGGSRDKE